MPGRSQFFPPTWHGNGLCGPHSRWAPRAGVPGLDDRPIRLDDKDAWRSYRRSLSKKIMGARIYFIMRQGIDWMPILVRASSSVG